MTTQSAMRMVESGQTITWPSSREAGVFGSLDMAVEDLGYLMKRHRLREDRTENIPSRSGSAPPSMEGSFAALRNLLKQQEGNSTVLSRDIEKYDSEEEIRSDPAYVAYYLSNINLNPRLPPPLISRENQHLVRRFGGLGDDSSPSSVDNVGIGKRLLLPSRSALSTHSEVSEDEALGEQSYVSSGGRHKSLVDLIQEDFPRTPSPVFNQPHPGKNHPTAEELIDCDIHAIPSDISSENAARLPESDIVSVNMMRETDSLPLYATEDPFNGISSSHSVDGTRNSPNLQKERSKAIGKTRDDLSAYSVSPSNDSRMRKSQEEQQSHGRRLSLQYPSSSHQLQTSAPQMTYGFTENTLQNLPKLSKPEVHSNFTSPRMSTTPLYTSTAAYMNTVSPFYQNFQPSGMYIPQYNYSGYPPGTGLLPPYMTGYPSHGATVPMPYDVSSSSSYDTRQLGGSTGQNVPSLVDPYQMQYFQPALGGDAYASSFQNIDSFRQKDQASGFMAANQDLHGPMNMNLGLQSPRHMGMGGSNYFAVPPGVRVAPQYLGSPLSGSPVLPSSPVGGMAQLGRRGEARYHQGSSRNVRAYPEWQGHRGSNNIDELKRHSFLDELKSPNARKFELSDIAGRIFEFSVDQHGSRFIQQKLEHCTDEEKASVFSEVLPHASKLMTDVFGNYVIQKFLEYGSPEQRQELVNQLAGQIVSLSMQMYGCRVIQKALEVIDLDQKTELISELDGHVMGCVRDQNGNHVIQKCIETIPSNRIGFIIAAFSGQVSTLSTHPYGCRVIQRILEHCADDEETRCIVDEILESAYVLAHDQYGNYVTQHVLERGRPDERSEIIKKLTGNVVQMSQHKYASNVVEKCLEYADDAEREVLIEEIMGKSEEDNHLLAMMKDQFANYVVQKVLEISKDGQREVLVQRVKVHLESLRKYTYGKHIVVRFERLFGEEGESSEQV